MADSLFIGVIRGEDRALWVTADTEAGTVQIEISLKGANGIELSSTDAHYLASLLRTAVDMIDFRAQLDAHR